MFILSRGGFLHVFGRIRNPCDPWESSYKTSHELFGRLDFQGIYIYTAGYIYYMHIISYFHLYDQNISKLSPNSTYQFHCQNKQQNQPFFWRGKQIVVLFRIMDLVVFH